MTTHRLNLRIDDNLHRKLQQLRERGYNVSELLRQTAERMADELLTQTTYNHTDR